MDNYVAIKNQTLEGRPIKKSPITQILSHPRLINPGVSGTPPQYCHLTAGRVREEAEAPEAETPGVQEKIKR